MVCAARHSSPWNTYTVTGYATAANGQNKIFLFIVVISGAQRKICNNAFPLNIVREKAIEVLRPHDIVLDHLNAPVLRVGKDRKKKKKVPRPCQGNWYCYANLSRILFVFIQIILNFATQKQKEYENEEGF